MVTLKGIQEPDSYYKAKRVAILTSIPLVIVFIVIYILHFLQVISNQFELIVLSTVLILSVLNLILTIRNNKQLKKATGAQEITITNQDIVIKHVKGTAQFELDDINALQVNYSKLEKMEEDELQSVIDPKQTKKNSIEITPSSGKKQSFYFIVDSFYLEKQFLKQIEIWQNQNQFQFELNLNQ